MSWYLEQYFCLSDFDLLLNRLVAKIRSSIFLSKEAPLAAIGEARSQTDVGRTGNTFLLWKQSALSKRATCGGPFCQPLSLPHLSPSAFLSPYLFFSPTPSLVPSFLAFWQEHFHLLLRGFQMSLQEMLVCLSGSSRALWLWQTSFNWEEARRFGKNWNSHETPFIRHNLNSAWKKNCMYKEKSTSPPAASPSLRLLLSVPIRRQKQHWQIALLQFSESGKVHSYSIGGRVEKKAGLTSPTCLHTPPYTHTHTHTQCVQPEDWLR